MGRQHTQDTRIAVYTTIPVQYARTRTRDECVGHETDHERCILLYLVLLYITRTVHTRTGKKYGALLENFYLREHHTKKKSNTSKFEVFTWYEVLATPIGGVKRNNK